MPDKLRHGKGKQHPNSKKGKAKQRSLTPVAQQQVIAHTREPAVPAGISAPSASVPTQSATTGAVRYPYITAELRRIGILAGIMLVILIVLALVLS